MSCGAAGAEDAHPAIAFRSPSPEDADAVRFGSPRHEEAEGLQPHASRTPAGSTAEAASPARGTATGSPSGEKPEGAGGDEELQTDDAMVSTPATRAGFPGFTAGQGAAFHRSCTSRSSCHGTRSRAS